MVGQVGWETIERLVVIMRDFNVWILYLYEKKGNGKDNLTENAFLSKNLNNPTTPYGQKSDYGF